MIDHIGQIPAQAAQKYGDKTALIFEDKSFNFNTLNALIEAAAGGLSNLGIVQGDTVTLYAANSWEWVVSYYAMARLGAVINPVNTMLTPAEIEYVVTDCGVKAIRRDRPPVGDKWHLDEVVILIRGKKHWLWRAVDQNGNALEIFVQSRRNTKAAKRFMRKLMKQYGMPRVIITDKLRSYGAAKRDLAPGLEHRSHKGLNNAAEVSHKATRRRERVMGRFKSPRHVQQILSAHDQINVLFRPRRHQLSAISYRHARSDDFSVWHDITCEIAAG